MEAQASRGHEVHYFLSGRHYPLIGTRLRRWTRAGVEMHELLNSPVWVGPADRGTRRPELDVAEPAAERLFSDVIDQVDPHVVHVQDLGGLPSSVLDLARGRG